MGIILIVPMSLLCALFGIHLAGLDNDIFTQIGFIVLIGLACKNAVLIIEFATHEERHKHLKPFDAALSASKLRLRPILMTSFAFILGVVPLMLAKGAGAEMRRTLGTALFGIFLTPVFYLVIRWISGNKPLGEHGAPKKEDAEPEASHSPEPVAAH
jgi:multidrug efflux pump subunit AcrB